MLPTVALVGRPNAGKSTFFNRIIGGRVAVTSKVPGTTRDRVYRDAEWGGIDFRLVDTGGIEVLTGAESDDPIKSSIQREIDFALEEADVIIFLVDVRSDITQIEYRVAERLRRIDKKVFFVANKADDSKFYREDAREEEYYRLMKLGFGDPILLSALHGIGVADFLDLLADYLRNEYQEVQGVHFEHDGIKVAILGRPNAGKSTLFNKISQTAQKSIATAIPHTTRDPVWGRLEWRDQSIKVWDTAGIRKARSIDEKIEFYSSRRAFQTIELVDVVIIVVDVAEEMVSRQDLNLIRQAERFGKGVIVFLNKWDEIKEQKDKYGDLLRDRLVEVLRKEHWWVKTVWGSGLTGKNVEKLLDAILEVEKARSTEFSKEEIREIYEDLEVNFYPTTNAGPARPKIYSFRQKFSNPPCFEVKVKNKKNFGGKFERFLRNKIRDKFDLTGSPIYIDYKEAVFKKK